MAITHEDIQVLKKEFDDRYVQIIDCDNVQENFNKKFANDDKRIDMLVHEQKQNNKLTWAILVGVVCLIIEGVISKFL